MVALALVSGSTCEACTDPPNLIVHLCGKTSHVKKKVGLCPTWQPATFFYESKIPDIEAGLASADRRIDAARDRPSVVPSAWESSAPARDPGPLHDASWGTGVLFRPPAGSLRREPRMPAPSRKHHLGGEARRALELFIDLNGKTQAVLLGLLSHLPCKSKRALPSPVPERPNLIHEMGRRCR